MASAAALAGLSERAYPDGALRGRVALSDQTGKELAWAAVRAELQALRW